MSEITLKISREMAQRALAACEVNNDREAATALYKAITHAGINAVAHERMQSVVNAASILEQAVNSETQGGEEHYEAQLALCDAVQRFRTAK